MAESAQQVYARVVDMVGPDGHLPMPAMGGWDIFPWVVIDGALAPRGIRPPDDEPPRVGETPDKPCGSCAGFDPRRVVWEDDAWVLTHTGAPSGLPLVLMLHPRVHADLGTLDDDQASELGRITNRLIRIVEGLPNIGRCHTMRIGDGGAHLHQWFFGRTARLTTVMGSPALDWDDVIPPGPEHVWRADLHAVAEKLANWGGEARA